MLARRTPETAAGPVSPVVDTRRVRFVEEEKWDMKEVKRPRPKSLKQKVGPWKSWVGCEKGGKRG